MIQGAKSSDYGVTWTYFSNPPGVTGTANLSVSGNEAEYAQIQTNSTGQYVFSIWGRDNDSGDRIIQMVRSSDYGVTWTNPTSTPVSSSSSPNLSADGESARYPQISVNDSGNRAYTIWRRNNGNNNIIQTALSLDYGATWENPTTTPEGTTTPNLSQDGGGTSHPQIATSSSGLYVYPIWYRSKVVQTARGVYPTVNCTGQQYKATFPGQIDLINKITWEPVSGATSYRIYSDANLSQLLASFTTASGARQYLSHQKKKGISYTYYITWLDSNDNESVATSVTLP